MHMYACTALIIKRYNGENCKLISGTMSFTYVECYNTPYEEKDRKKGEDR
jgi:hypothetical protein